MLMLRRDYFTITGGFQPRRKENNLNSRLFANFVCETRLELRIRTYECDGCNYACLLYTSPSPRDRQKSRMPSSA